MSNCQNKMVKRCAGLVALVTCILVIAAAVVGTIFGVKGIGVFNRSAVLDDVKTLTVSMNQHVYTNNLDKVEDACENVFGSLNVTYEIKGEMSGDESEIIYVFDKAANLETVEKELENKFAAMTGDQGELKGSFITVAANDEKAVEYLAKNYVLRGVIAGVVLIAAVYVYAAIRFGIGKGLSVAFGTLYGTLLTVALVLLTRIPVTASISYVFAAAALMSAVTSVFTMNKIAASEKSESCNVCGCACKEILPICAFVCVGLILIGAIAWGVKWFALSAIIAVIASAVAGIMGVPFLYAPIKAAADKKPEKDAYVGAAKTSTKAKKVFTKKEAVKAEPVEETVEETVEEVAEEAPAEETVEETVEEVAEETPAEETVEETIEEVAEEAPAEETVEETVEEVAEEVSAEEATEEPAAE